MAEIVVTHSDESETRYTLPDELTYGELKRVKVIAGITPAGIVTGLESGDPATIEALTIISAARMGVEVTTDELDALPFGAITFVADEDDAERPTDEAAPGDAALPATTHDNGGNQS